MREVGHVFISVNMLWLPFALRLWSRPCIYFGSRCCWCWRLHGSCRAVVANACRSMYILPISNRCTPAADGPADAGMKWSAMMLDVVLGRPQPGSLSGLPQDIPFRRVLMVLQPVEFEDIVYWSGGSQSHS